MTEENGNPPRKIMVVDDNPEVLTVFKVGLEIGGHEVIPCADGSEAIDQYSTELPEIVIIDHELPGMSGIEVGTQIRQLENGESVVLALLTGTESRSLRQQALENGFDEFLVKPIPIRELAVWVNTVGKS